MSKFYLLKQNSAGSKGVKQPSLACIHIEPVVTKCYVIASQQFLIMYTNSLNLSLITNTLGAGVQYTHTLKSRMSHFSCVTLHHHNSPAD